jgi:hypothetical protein
MLKKILGDRRLIADVILIASLLVVSLSVLFIFFVNRTEGSFVEVSVNNQVVGKYSLLVNEVYSINGGSNILVIENGYAYVSEASCPGYQDCVEKGKIRFVGEMIVCSPNGVRIRVVGQGDGIDI